jgi:hypothetical protein
MDCLILILSKMRRKITMSLCTVLMTVVVMTTASAATVVVNSTTLNWNAATEVAEGVVNFSVDAPFVITIDGADYGYTPYSGNGCVGTVPATGSPIRLAGSYVDKSIGQLSLTSEGGELLWIATGSGGKIVVRVDLSYTDNIPRYYVALQRDEPNVVLRESFDLFTWGGDWTVGKVTDAYRWQGSAIFPHEYDGTEPAITTTSTGSTTANAANPNGGITSAYSPLFVKNRDLADWDVSNLYEHAGYPRLSTGTSKGATAFMGIAKTPAFGNKLFGISNVKVEFDVCKFPTLGGFYFSIEGPGSITSGAYIDLVESGIAYGGTYADNAKTTQTAIPGATGTSIYITSEAGGILPAWDGVNDDPKFWTHITINISGATSETKVVWCSSEADPSTNPSAGGRRFCLNNVLITNLSYTGIKNFDTGKSGMNVYPSVINEGQPVNIQLPEGMAKANIRIFDATGRVVTQLKNAGGKITAPSQKGIFFVQVQTPDATFAPQRIIVK